METYPTTLKEYLENQSIIELVELSTLTDSKTFEDGCIVKSLINIYELPEQFHVALVSLKLSILTEMTNRLKEMYDNE